MAVATLCLLQWKPLKFNPGRYPIQPPPSNTPLRFRRPLDGFPGLSVSCCLPSKNSALIPAKRKKDDTVRVPGALEALEKPAAAAILLGVLLTCNVSSALAASWGYSRSTTSYEPSPASSPVLESGYSYSTAYFAPSPAKAGAILFLIISMGFAAFLLASRFVSNRSEGEKISILKLQVGLQGTVIRPLQEGLNRLAETADTSTPSGKSFVLTEATLALLRHPGYCISGYSSVDLKRSTEDVEKSFNQLSIEERGKFIEEPLINVNNIRKQSSTAQSSNGISDEHLVITILVAAEGVHKLPAINGSGDLKEALQNLASIPSRKLLAVEVLWTPLDDNDTLPERELLEDYPLLRSL